MLLKFHVEFRIRAHQKNAYNIAADLVATNLIMKVVVVILVKVIVLRATKEGFMLNVKVNADELWRVDMCK